MAVIRHCATTREPFGVSVDETPMSRGEAYRQAADTSLILLILRGPFLRALGRGGLEAPGRATWNAGQDGQGGYEQRGACNNYS
jgi:hypothetical protein